jgi:hypothetical protein
MRTYEHRTAAACGKFALTSTSSSFVRATPGRRRGKIQGRADDVCFKHGSKNPCSSVAPKNLTAPIRLRQSDSRDRVTAASSFVQSTIPTQRSVASTVLTAAVTWRAALLGSSAASHWLRDPIQAAGRYTYFAGAPVPLKSPPNARCRFTRSRRRDARTFVFSILAARFSPARRMIVNMSVWP